MEKETAAAFLVILNGYLCFQYAFLIHQSHAFISVVLDDADLLCITLVQSFVIEWYTLC